MNRTDIVKKLSERIYGSASPSGIEKCSQFCDTLVDIFTESLLKGEKVLWQGFLKVEVVDQKARKGRNPQTNEVVTFPPTKTVRCKVSKFIKDKVNNQGG